MYCRAFRSTCFYSQSVHSGKKATHEFEMYHTGSNITVFFLENVEKMAIVYYKTTKLSIY